MVKKYRKSIRIHGELHQERFFTKEAANEWYVSMQKKKERIEAGIPAAIEISKVTVEEQARNVLSRMRKENAKGSMVVYWPRFRDYIIPRAGKMKLNLISSEDWTGILDDIQNNPPKNRKLEKLSNTTRNHIRGLINILYEQAIKTDKVALINPIAAVKRLAPAHVNTAMWKTRDEGIRYLSKAREVSPQFYLATVIYINWGNRQAEVTGLQWMDVNYDLGTIQVSKQWGQHENKLVHRLKEDRPDRTKKIKFIGINDSIKEALLHAWEHTPYRSPESFLVHQKRQDKPMSHNTIHAMHVRSCKAAGVTVIPHHSLRHYFASQFVMAGGTLEALQGILGHSSYKTTERYKHFSPQFLKDQANIVNFGVNLNDDNVRELPRKNKK